MRTDGAGLVWLHYAANTSLRLLNPNALDAMPLKGAVVLVGPQGAVVDTRRWGLPAPPMCWAKGWKICWPGRNWRGPAGRGRRKP